MRIDRLLTFGPKAPMIQGSPLELVQLKHLHWILALSLQFSPMAALAQPHTIDFEGLDGMTFFSGNTIPQQSQLSGQFLPTSGVSFSSGSPYVAVVNLGLGHATSGINGIGGATPGGVLTYDPAFPIVATFFDPKDPATPAVTDFVAVSIDQFGGTGLSVRLNAFDINDSLIGFATSPDIGGARLEISAPAIHSVHFLGTADEGGAALDDFTFNPVTPIPEPSSLVLSGAGLVTLLRAFRRRFSPSSSTTNDKSADYSSSPTAILS